MTWLKEKLGAGKIQVLATGITLAPPSYFWKWEGVEVYPACSQSVLYYEAFCNISAFELLSQILFFGCKQNYLIG